MSEGISFILEAIKKVRFAREYVVHAHHRPVTCTMSDEHTQHLEQAKPMNYLHRMCTCTLSDYELKN